MRCKNSVLISRKKAFQSRVTILLAATQFDYCVNDFIYSSRQCQNHNLMRRDRCRYTAMPWHDLASSTQGNLPQW